MSKLSILLIVSYFLLFFLHFVEVLVKLTKKNPYIEDFLYNNIFFLVINLFNVDLIQSYNRPFVNKNQLTDDLSKEVGVVYT